MKAFVTGATGFVGSHVARALANHGADLRLLVRASSPTRNIDGLHAERVVGDLREPDSLRTAIAGCEVVFHVAADYRLWTRDAADMQSMYRSNVEGTRALIDAARQAGVRRIVYCSSVATMGFTGNGRPADENSPVRLEDMIGHYKRSKFIAEQVAIEAGRSGGDVVVVNPTTPVGEGDVKPTPTGRIILDFLKRKFPAYVDTGLNLVDVREVARGHIAALEKGTPGERYILGGENLTLKQILDKLAAITIQQEIASLDATQKEVEKSLADLEKQESIPAETRDAFIDDLIKPLLQGLANCSVFAAKTLLHQDMAEIFAYFKTE